MNWSISITAKAETDLNCAADYIEYVLLNPDAADSLLDEAEKTIHSLTDFPKKHPPVDDPVLKAWEIRFVNVKDYTVFYKISEDDNTIYIVRFLHEKRDWISILKKGVIRDGSF